MPPFQMLMAIVGVTATALAAGYAVVALTAVLVWHARKAATIPRVLPPVTVLKPLCGAEPGLYEHLRSFCLQDYPDYQIVFGMRDPADPALAVVRRLAEEFPQLPIEIVVNPQQHGSNCKISNLINMAARARHDVLVMADSDISVGPGYLATVTASLQHPRHGLVTCLYRGVPTASIWSRLGAMYINEWYVPSVLLAHLFGFRGYAFGQTLCLRRETLQAIGGLPAIADHLADDNRLGELVRGLGLRIVLSPYMVEAQHHEPCLNSLARHELRWMRTTRVLRPRSSCFMFFSFSLPLAALGVLLAAGTPATAAWAWTLFGVTAAARVALHFSQRPGSGVSLLADAWLLPLRDLLTCLVWCWSFVSYRVSWRGVEFDVAADGVMRRLS
jgi:ceramide glucosyltransferase